MRENARTPSSDPRVRRVRVALVIWCPGGGGSGADRGGMQPLVYRRSVGFGVPSSRASRMQVLYLHAATQWKKDDPKGLLQINFCRDAFQPYLTVIPLEKPDGFYIYTRAHSAVK